MDEILMGLPLGFGAGLALGPLMALVISTTLQSGMTAGGRIAFSPLLTDIVIIVVAVALAASLPQWTLTAPLLAHHGPVSGSLFLGAFYFVLIGSKVGVAAAVAAGRNRLMEGRGYTILLRTSALLLLATGVVLVVGGIGSLV